MRKPQAFRLAIIAVAPMLFGCADAGNVNQAAGPREVSADQKAYLVANKATLVKDPGSIRDAMIGSVIPSIFGEEVCIKLNSKNSYGGYVGQQTLVVIIYRNGAPPLLQEATIYSGCWRDAYAPFPEIEGDYRPPAPPPPAADASKRRSGRP